MTTPNVQPSLSEALDRISHVITVEEESAFATIRQACEPARFQATLDEAVIARIADLEAKNAELQQRLRGIRKFYDGANDSLNEAVRHVESLTQERDTLKAKLDAAPHGQFCGDPFDPETPYKCNCWKSRVEG